MKMEIVLTHYAKAENIIQGQKTNWNAWIVFRDAKLVLAQLKKTAKRILVKMNVQKDNIFYLLPACVKIVLRVARFALDQKKVIA